MKVWLATSIILIVAVVFGAVVFVLASSSPSMTTSAQSSTGCILLSNNGQGFGDQIMQFECTANGQKVLCVVDEYGYSGGVWCRVEP